MCLQGTSESFWDLDEAKKAAAAHTAASPRSKQPTPVQSPGNNTNPYAPENIKRRRDQKAAVAYREQAKHRFRQGVAVGVSLPNMKHQDKMDWDLSMLKQALEPEDWEVLEGRVDSALLENDTVRVRMPNDSMTDWSFMVISIFSLEELTTARKAALTDEETTVARHLMRNKSGRRTPKPTPKPEPGRWTWKHTLGLAAVLITAPLSGPAIAAGCTAAGVGATTAGVAAITVGGVGGGLASVAIIEDGGGYE